MIYIEERELACFVYLMHHPRSQFTKLFSQAIFYFHSALSLFMYFRSISGLSSMLQVTWIKQFRS